MAHLVEIVMIWKDIFDESTQVFRVETPTLSDSVISEIDFQVIER